MRETMMAVVKARPERGVEIRQVRVPAPGPRDVLVKVEAASICGTDLHIYNWDEWASSRMHPPVIPGHEFCGRVVSYGREVHDLAEGDFVSAEMHVACGRCFQCRTGSAHICAKVKIIGVDSDGAFAEYVIIPDSNIWKLDPRIPPEWAAVFDPLGNAVHTVMESHVASRTVAVTGCGPIGLFAIAIARACGATRIFATEVNAYRLGLAKQMGADVLLNPGECDPVARVMDETGGAGVDVVLEMAGHPNSIHQGLAMLRPGGLISLLGIPSRPMEIDISRDVIFKGITVKGIHGRRMYDTWYQMQALLVSHRVDISPAISGHLQLDQFDKGIEMLLGGRASKILLYPGKAPAHQPDLWPQHHSVTLPTS
jgi:threonine 3-dehydrogenase